jgi:signal transduction histidine kinase
MRFKDLRASNNWRSIAALIIALTFGLVVNELLFGVASKFQGHVAEVALKDLLDRTELLQNPYSLGQEVSNLQHLDLIQCTSMISKKRADLAGYVNFAQGEECENHFNSFFIPTLTVHRTLQAGNGEAIEVNYQVVLGIGYAITLWGSRFLWVMLISVFWYTIRSRIKHQEEVMRLETEKATEVSGIAEQVSHDLVSPLVALDGLLIEAHDSQIPEETRASIRNNLGKIRDIVNSLKDHSKQKEPVPVVAITSVPKLEQSVQLLSDLIEREITEKRTEMKGRNKISLDFQITRENACLFALVNPTKFQSILSNILNNAFNAIKADGKIEVVLTKERRSVQIEIKDNGPGIPQNVIDRIGERGVTSGVPGGKGLGVYDAKKTIEEWRGDLSIRSPQGGGTSVKILLPETQPPTWFFQSIHLRPGQTIVAVDDDSGMHEIWKKRFESFQTGENPISVFHFHSARTFKQWFRNAGKKLDLVSYFFDYELLGESENGLDLIENFGISSRSVLVTSRFDLPLIRERCGRLKVRLLPKKLSSWIPIDCVDPLSQKFDAILIDDSSTYHTRWINSSDKHHKTVKLFFSPSRFFDMEWQIDRATPIFVDVDLGDGISGEVVSREIFERGFKKVHLATDYDADNFDLKALPWISSIRKKTPPWDENPG